MSIKIDDDFMCDLVYRTLTYLLPIPVGSITYLIWRRKKSWLKPRGTEPQPSG